MQIQRIIRYEAASQLSRVPLQALASRLRSLVAAKPRQTFRSHLRGHRGRQPKEIHVAIANPRPSELTLSVTRVAVDGSCPRCAAATLQSYEVLSEGGWFDVVKCAHCLHSVKRDKGPRLGPIELLSDRV